MHRELPPFVALKAFEASARLGSFKSAADELCLTQSAISHRIKELEDYIGVSLFHRLARRIELTERGQSYLGELGDVIDRIEMATARARGKSHGGEIVLRGTPAVISRWVAPRIGKFRQSFCGTELYLSTSIENVDFATDNVDIAIEWGLTKRAGVEVLPFFETVSFVVASPLLLRRAGQLRHPSDLRRLTLLHNRTGDAWQQWLEAAGADGVDAGAGPRFEHCDLALTAAIEGQGAALCFDRLARFDIAEGRLVRLFNVELPPRAIYLLAISTHRVKRPHITAVRDWLLAEAHDEPIEAAA